MASAYTEASRATTATSAVFDCLEKQAGIVLFKAVQILNAPTDEQSYNAICTVRPFLEALRTAVGKIQETYSQGSVSSYHITLEPLNAASNKSSKEVQGRSLARALTICENDQALAEKETIREKLQDVRRGLTTAYSLCSAEQDETLQSGDTHPGESSTRTNESFGKHINHMLQLLKLPLDAPVLAENSTFGLEPASEGIRRYEDPKYQAMCDKWLGTDPSGQLSRTLGSVYDVARSKAVEKRDEEPRTAVNISPSV